MKKLCAILLILTVLFCVSGCNRKTDGTVVNVSVLSGPTGIGALNLWDSAEKGESKLKYNFKLCANNDEIVADIVSKNADIAAVATNQAAMLYNKTNGGVTVLCVNTESVLYLLSLNGEITDITELKNKTVYLTGQGANPQYALEYVLTKSGMDVQTDVNLKFVSDANELSAVFASKENADAVILAPQPVATSILSKYENVKQGINLGDEWAKYGNGKLLMGCVTVQNEFLKNNKSAVDEFLKEYEQSIIKAQTDTDITANLCEQKGIIPKSAVAKKALPYCGLTYIDGESMKNNLSKYLTVMYNANEKSVGGKLPKDDFYYEKNS